MARRDGSGPLTLAERWSGGRWRIQLTPAVFGAYDIGLSGVACPAVSACHAVGSYTNNGPSLTLAEQWNPTGTSTHAAARPVAPGSLPAACLRALPRQPLSASGQTPASDRRWSPAQPCLLQPAPRSQPGFAGA